MDVFSFHGMETNRRERIQKHHRLHIHHFLHILNHRNDEIQWYYLHLVVLVQERLHRRVCVAVAMFVQHASV